jgi:hypothetical protein
MKVRTMMVAATATLLTAAPLMAQEHGVGGQDASGYVTGLGGFATQSRIPRATCSLKVVRASLRT